MAVYARGRVVGNNFLLCLSLLHLWDCVSRVAATRGVCSTSIIRNDCFPSTSPFPPTTISEDGSLDEAGVAAFLDRVVGGDATFTKASDLPDLAPEEGCSD